jgi:hypothetical protein
MPKLAKENVVIKRPQKSLERKVNTCYPTAVGKWGITVSTIHFVGVAVRKESLPLRHLSCWDCSNSSRLWSKVGGPTEALREADDLSESVSAAMGTAPTGAPLCPFYLIPSPFFLFWFLCVNEMKAKF